MAAEQSSSSRINEAEDARDELAASLKYAGIQLPVMDVKQKQTHGLVVLGEVSPPVALQLAAVIARGPVR